MSKTFLIYFNSLDLSLTFILVSNGTKMFMQDMQALSSVC